VSGLRIAMWSGPRNISTAMMRAWENRADTKVVDEPLYAYYLATTGIEHPGRYEILASQTQDWREVVEKLTAPVAEGGIYYQKHMTHHITPEIDLDWLDALRNVFLIRAPEEVVLSYGRVRGGAAIEELGFLQQARIFDHVVERIDEYPIVVDARSVLENPEGVLRALCDRLGVAFSAEMLRWPAGPRESDGVWAPWWYAAVEKSTGFQAYRAKSDELGPEQRELARRCRPAYERLAEYAISAS